MNSTGYPGLAADKELGCEEATPAEGIMLNPRGERRTTALGEIRDLLTPDRHRVKLEESCMAFVNSISHMTWIHHGWMWFKAIPDLGGYLL